MVLRQPFGGMGKSALGAGIKVGGPNYLTQFMVFDEMDFPRFGPLSRESSLLSVMQEWEIKLLWGRLKKWRVDLEKTVFGVRSCLYWMEEVFSKEADYFNLRGQDNVFRYLPYDRVIVRVHERDTLFELLTRVAAARIAGCETILSIRSGTRSRAARFLNTADSIRFLDGLVPREQTDEELIRSLSSMPLIRYAATDRVPGSVYEAAAESGCYISRDPVLMEGRIEMIRYFHEQSLCNTYHRYGNLGERACSHG